MNNLLKKGLLAPVVMVAVIAAPLTSADSLTLPTTPLIVGSSVEPNLMLLLDSSGSMSNIVPDSPYDATTASYVCSGSKMSNASQIDISISAGVAKFNGNLFGNGSGEQCFDDDLIYNARLYANNSGNTAPNGYLSASYTGKYLNWYFDSSTGAFVDGKKQGTNSRMEITKIASTDLINQLAGIRVGLSKYNGSDGAQILANVDALDATQGDGTHSDFLKEEIDDINNGGMTPLGESLADIGRYFTLGYPASSSLILHPNEASQSVATSSVFTNNLAYQSGVTAPTEVTQYWCQQNFVVAMTDGVPTNDDTISSYLRSYYDNSGEILDDIALAMFDMDLRPDLKNGTTQVTNNVTTHVVGFADQTVVNSTLMQQTADNGGGTFIGAADSAGLISAFQSASQSIFAKAAAWNAVSFNTSQLSEDSALFQASFNTSGWQGSLRAYELDDDGLVAQDASWDAGTKLDSVATSTRKIFTYNGSEGVEFIADNFDDLSSSQQDDLRAGVDADNDGSSDDDDAKLLINYMRGDNANEGSGVNQYRARSSRLGDIVNSTSVYVAEPEMNWPDYDKDAEVDFGDKDDDTYSKFKSDNANRTPMIYIGANDGMLHGFNAELTSNGGQEKMAYIPGLIASSQDEAGMHYLADKDYAHQFYVDLTPTVNDVYIDDAWHSILVGGLRAGGRGLFALDITDPSKFNDLDNNAEDLVLWEFSHADDPDFGYSYSKPTIAMMANGEWAVIVGNGYNNSGSGTASLFILFIEEGIGGNWETKDYVKIDTEVGSSGTPNGLSTPTVVDSNGDSIADRVYAGDLQGNMWAFDISDKDDKKWKVAYKSGDSPSPLFTAINDDGQVQPITSAPLVTTNSTTSGASPNLLVFFGAGKYLEETDITSNQQVMSYYSVQDAGAGNKLRGDLRARTLLTSGDLRTITGSSWSGTSGWYIDLVNRVNAGDTAINYGERVVADSVLSGGVIFFNSIIPDSAACSFGGQSWFMSVDLDTGLAPNYGIFDADDDGVIEHSAAADGGDQGYIGQKYTSGLVSSSAMLEYIQYTVDSNGLLLEREVYVGESANRGRVSWEEMIQDE